MTTHADDPRRIVTDFLVWLEQNDADGDAWFLDEGPVAPLPAAVASGPRKDEPMADAKPGPASDPAPHALPGVDPDDPFAEECRRFVTATLASIERQGGLPPAVAGGGEPEPVLTVLRDKVASCTACALHEGRTRTVFGTGNPRADVLFIGEAPGRDEDLQGEPFVGRSGQLLTKIIGAIGFSRQDVYICNILKCRPPDNRDPLPAEVACCEPFLKQQLAVIRPRVICCLGRIAAQTLLKTDASLRALRETAHFYEGIPVMATYHPAALLRNPGWKRQTWNDVRKLRALSDALAAGEPEEN
jgi:uracil-DNA glycosylase family 4